MKRTLAFLVLIFAGAVVRPAAAEEICTLVADVRTGAIVVEEGDCDARVTSASTFKIALAVMAYDAGILTDAHAPVRSFRTGDPDWGGANWKRDTDPASWMRHSVLWYSQRIAREMGVAELSRYAREFSYGTADFSGDPGFDNGIERAWISSSLRISPREQASFLGALATDGLPVRPDAMRRARDIVESHVVGGWVVRGKTGTAYPRRADRSFDYARGWGWYVGWAQSGDRLLTFARLTQARRRTEGSPGNLTREAFLREWPDLAGR